MFLMRRDLKYAVCACVANGPAGLNVLCPEPCQYICARSVRIAQNTVNPGYVLNGLNDVIRKSGCFIGEIMPVPGHGQARQFPVPGWRVFAF